MRIAVTGPNGYIGKALVKAGAIPINADVTNYDLLRAEIGKANPDFIFHLAAKTNVEFCEDQANFDTAYAVNIRGTHNVASIISLNRINGVFLSSYHIWAGNPFESHKERSPGSKGIKNRYGMMKVAAEEVALSGNMSVVRTSYVFNKERLSARIKSLEEGKEIQEPVFMTRSFIHLDHFVDLLMDYSMRYFNMPRTLHLAGSNSTNWFKFMRTTAEMLGLGKELVAPRFTEDKKFAPRPWNGSLDVALSRSLRFKRHDYLEGIERMKDES